MRQESAFARKIPRGEEPRQWIEHRLAYSPDMWTDKTLEKRDREGEFEMARFAGLPDWLTRALLSLRAKRAGARRRGDSEHADRAS